MALRTPVLLASCVGPLVLFLACNNSPPPLGSKDVSSTGGQIGGTIVIPTGGGLVIPTGGATGGARSGNGTPETCNGKDDDENGIVDDLDKDKDGVCDCIRIATLGDAGTWGEGDVFGAWLTARASDGAKALGNEVITPDLIKNFQVIVVQNVREAVIGRTFSADEVKAVEDWVRAGGGLMTLIGFADATEVVNVNLLLAPFGMSYANKRILPKGAGNSTVAITQFSTHPITTSVKAVGVDTGYEVQGEGTVYAEGGGFKLGLARTVDKGRVNLWGDEWITYNSEWTEHPDYQVELFWVNSIKWLTPANVCQVAIPPALIP